MRRFLVRFGLLVLSLAVVAVGAVATLLVWLRGEMPIHAGTITVSGLSAPVEVVRDARAVPHIFAATEADGYFALGFVHAQDRLFQMELMRRIGAGRLAELVGTRLGDWALGIDRMMRTLGLYRQAEASVANLAPATRAALDAYAAGVNAWMSRRTEALPVEFQILLHEPEPWRPADSLVWGKLMALQLSGNAREELANARFTQRFSSDEMRDLFPERAAGGPVTLAGALAGFDVARLLDAFPSLGPGLASNEWVLSGARTVSGKPILANDPHLGLEAPILWYLARIVTPGHTIAGATVAGVPMHPLGHNGTVAWGFTTTHSDVQDLFIEKLDPVDPGRYLIPDGSEPFRTRVETIRVRGGGDVTLSVRETRHGPVVSDLAVFGGAPDAVPPGHVLALAFTGLSDGDTTADALYALNHARSADDVPAALSGHIAPQQNIVYADTAGAIGFIAPARVPVRRQGDGTLPVPGWTGEFDWTGFVPEAALPRAENPPSGQFVNANNAVVGADYPYLLTADWPDPARAQRIEQVLGAARHGVDQMATLQMDAVSLPARTLLPHLLRVKVDDGRVAEAVIQLRDWDGRMRQGRPEPLIYAWWMRELVRTIFADELGPLFAGYWDVRPRAVLRTLTEAPRWCDDVTTAATETCADALNRSLKAALAILEERHGPHLVTWRWGDEHKATLNHRLLGRIPVIAGLFDLSVPTDGDGFTVSRGGTHVADERTPFTHVHGAGFRAVYDLADLDASRFVIATGQSGNPLSDHWGDFVGLWAAGRAVTLAGDREGLLRSGAALLTLRPGPEGAAR